MLRLPKRRLKRFALLGLAVFFFGAGASHFANPDFFVGIMPPYLPAHLELVYLSGLLEILGGVALLAPGLSHVSRLGPGHPSPRGLSGEPAYGPAPGVVPRRHQVRALFAAPRPAALHCLDILGDAARR